jgi:hypothetical protein
VKIDPRDEVDEDLAIVARPSAVRRSSLPPLRPRRIDPTTLPTMQLRPVGVRGGRRFDPDDQPPPA